MADHPKIGLVLILELLYNIIYIHTRVIVLGFLTSERWNLPYNQM